ncbi:carbohydrate binding domain-containing protein [Pedosphaera parvula]|uniref:Carbohydrate-binding CenC domain protein n=1 Tax=Pedosphaera parvula (strain Ellin514) TaxID=320771 RepID=B9XH36_PEDPL|nr:carbohydrate binding domain-containing protein [Pedosphaera parvula]EEF60957.1 Carbohydrate-binding CenC domain protein [Pedosphaera parvula Ellin514]
MFLQAGIASAQNLATNSGFETGNTTGWFAFGSPVISAQTSQVHSGSYAALVTNRTASYMGIAQSFKGAFQAGQTYNISAWLRLVSGTNQTMQLTMQKVDGGGTAYSAVASGSVSTNGWTQLSGQFSFDYSGSLTSLVLYAEVPNSANAAYFLDDLLVESQNTSNITAQSTVNWTNTFQRIDGFGASSAWRSSLTTAQEDMFFSTNTGIGLSLLRTRIAPGATTIENSIMQMAQARGARVWSSPWSPQTSFKSANADGVISVNGGPFIGNAANYQAYANQLAGYVVKMQATYGINLYALSVQNEPDTDTTNYESCVWTGQQFHDFIPYLSAALTASNVAATKIMLPESIHWPNTSLHTPTMNDAAVAPLIGIVANHNYDGPNFQTGATAPPVALNNYGKALWETEVSTGDSFDGSITNAVYWAGRIHQFITVAQVNAWHFWWLISGTGGSDNQGLTDSSGNPAKRMYALGNFSRFVRPNFYRIGVSNAGPVQISAYKDPTNGNFAIVAINSGATTVSQVFNLAGFTTTNLTAWVTSATLSLSSQTPFVVSGLSFTNSIAPLSIVTFVGRAVPGNVNEAPVLVPIADATIAAGASLTITNTATDPDVPPQTLTYTLLNGPGNSALNPSNGVFSWRPLVSQQNSTNPVSVRVTDNGTPPLAATNNFVLTVSALSPPGIRSIAVAETQVSLGITGSLGPDYTLWSTTNLTDWQPLVTNTPATMPLTITITNTNPQRFYRLQLGP